MNGKVSGNSPIWMVTPFEKPDAGLALAAAKAGAFSALHLGRDRLAAERALAELAKRPYAFGVCVACDSLGGGEAVDGAVGVVGADGVASAAWGGIALPANIVKIIAPWGTRLPAEYAGIETVRQIRTAAEAEEAVAAGERAVIIKGAESAGICGEDSSFILFQRLIARFRDAGIATYIQGGVGVHSAAAYMALGASGVVLDSQAALFPECGMPQERKALLGKLSGNEIRIQDGFRHYIYPGSDGAAAAKSRLAAGDSSIGGLLRSHPDDVVALGQDVILSSDLAGEYKKLGALVRALKRASFTHMNQSMISDAFAKGGEAAVELGTEYPIAQGPMARISDVPDFLRRVADGGALPFLAMGLSSGKEASASLAETSAQMGGKPWGAGILGFAFPWVLEEQTKLIIDAAPPFVLIAGGRPAQARPFERAGIKALLHAPTPGMLDMFIKEGARRYIFEGRESGGHVGPLFSAVLWEKQINRILNVINPTDMLAFFAGGIHDAFSAAFVRVMSGPIAARGAKTGLLCGTAYLFTEEAVDSGAITRTYRDLILERDETLLLKSGVGQETRCVDSGFVRHFFDEKAKMEKEGLKNAEILLKLEDLNLGRLRIASKGVERSGGGYAKISESEQLEKGLYMAGAVTSIKKATTTIADLHKALTSDSRDLLHAISRLSGCAAVESAAAGVAGSAGSAGPAGLAGLKAAAAAGAAEETPKGRVDVAIIGMAGIFPGAADIDEFWRNIVYARDCITEVPKERWPVDLFYDPDAADTDHVVSKWGGFIDKTDFDALEFGITPQSLASIEPAQLLSLLVAKRALEDAGFKDLTREDMENTSVIFGAQSLGELANAYGSRPGLIQLLGGLPEEADRILPRLTEDSFPGVLSNVTAGRISNRLDTGGRNFTVDAACASSLAALDIAIAELISGRSDMVVLGGSDTHNGIFDYLMFSSTHALSRKGRCATFDVDADGITIGEGIGVVILKRLADAERDGNNIYAVIKGTGASSDGKNLGLTAPSRRGQVRALENAYENAGISPSEVGFIEPHGTGTAIGDRIELRALTEVFLDAGARPGGTSLSSIKSLIGHTKCAAGVAGLIKAVNCVRHGVIPPALHLKKPNEYYTRNSPFAFRTEKAGHWGGERRIAGVSGFGFGGTNYHAVIESYGTERPSAVLKAWPSEIFVFRGESADDAAGVMEKIKELYANDAKLRIRDVSYSLSIENVDKPAQYVIVAGSPDQLVSRMDAVLGGAEDEYARKVKPVDGKVAFLFSGQGSQRVNMAADLFLLFPRMRRLLDEVPELEKILFPDASFSDEGKKSQNAAITDTRNAQPLLGIVDLAIAGLLGEFGVAADMAAGHSYGELPALCYAGVFDESDLVRLSVARAESILASVGADRGRMAAIAADAKAASKLLDGLDGVWPVNYNTPRQIVAAVTDAGMDALLKKARDAGIMCNELNVACAFHSPLIKGADERYAWTLAGTSFGKPKIPVWSNTTAGPYPESENEIKERLCSHLVNPVRFADEIRAMNEGGASVFIETGPGNVLTKLVSEILREKEIAVIQTERGASDGLTVFLQALAKYMATGRTIDMEKLYEGRDAVRLDINEPSAYRKSGTVWSVDGRAAAPEGGAAPYYTGKPLLDVDELYGRIGSNAINAKEDKAAGAAAESYSINSPIKSSFVNAAAESNPAKYSVESNPSKSSVGSGDANNGHGAYNSNGFAAGDAYVRENGRYSNGGNGGNGVAGAYGSYGPPEGNKFGGVPAAYGNDAGSATPHNNGGFAAAYGGNGGITVEHVLLSYLENINSANRDQRDVLLGYLGVAGGSARRPFMPAAQGRRNIPAAPQNNGYNGTASFNNGYNVTASNNNGYGGTQSYGNGYGAFTTPEATYTQPNPPVYAASPNGMPYQTAPDGAAYPYMPDGMAYTAAPTAEYQSAPGGVYQAAPDGAAYPAPPNGMPYPAAPSNGMSYQAASDGMTYTAMPDGMAYSNMTAAAYQADPNAAIYPPEPYDASHSVPNAVFAPDDTGETFVSDAVYMPDASYELPVVSYEDPVTSVETQSEDNDIPQDEAESGLPDISTLTNEQIMAIVFEITSDKTGYPVSMLEPEMDLEADLSIDSIKKMEIIDGLQSKVVFPKTNLSGDALFERMISVRKFSDLSAWIEELGRAAADGGGVEEEAFKGAALAVDLGDEQLYEDEATEFEGGMMQSDAAIATDLNVVSSVDAAKDLNIAPSVEATAIHETAPSANATVDLNDAPSLDAAASRYVMPSANDAADAGAVPISAQPAESKPVTYIQSAESAHSAINAMLAADAYYSEGIDEDAAEANRGIIRMVYDYKEFPVLKKDVAPLAGKIFMLTEDGHGLASRLAASLNAVGANAYIVEGKNIPDFNGNAIPDVYGCDGLIVINSALGSARHTVADLFRMLKLADMNRLQWLLVFDDSLSAASEPAAWNMSQGKPGRVPELPEGFSGFIKSLFFEYPGKNLRSVVSLNMFKIGSFAEIAMDELNTSMPVNEIIYRDGVRTVMYPKITPLTVGGKKSKLDVLDRDSVIVVLGGAQGIVPYAIEKLAAVVPCNYILIGRTHDGLTKAEYDGLDTVTDIRRYLIESEGMRQPREIETKAWKIFKLKRVHASIERIEKIGARTEYITVDATDTSAFISTLKAIKAKYGKIDGVIHAAGIIEDKLFRNKELDSFVRVYNTKNMPMKTILNELLPDLKLLAFYSSATSPFGVAGQADYAAGNNTLDYAASILKRLMPSLNVKAFDWGPWKGAGMVNESLEREFAKRGVPLIGIDEGSDLFVNELKYGDEASVIIMSNADGRVTEFMDGMNNYV